MFGVELPWHSQLNVRVCYDDISSLKLHSG